MHCGAVVATLRWSSGPSLRERRPELWFGALVVAFLAGLALLAWLLLGAPLLLDPDSYGWLRTEPSIIDWLNTPDGYTPAAYLACLLTVVVVVLLARSLRLGGRSLLLAAAAAAGLLILILVASFGMRLGWLGTLVPAEVSLSAGVAVWTCSSSC